MNYTDPPLELLRYCVYDGEDLQVYYTKSLSLFIQKWKNIGELDHESFKHSMLAYTECYKKFAPKRSIWLQEKFRLQLTENDFEWIEVNVNQPCWVFGNKKLAFVLGNDLVTHLEVMKSFKEVESCINPQHFSSFNSAYKWILESEVEEDNDTKVSYHQSAVLKEFEKTVVRQVCSGESPETIAQLYKMTTPQVMQILRNIYSKLKVSNFKELIRYDQLEIGRTNSSQENIQQK